jgi:phosphomevalonate kinase
MGERPALKSCLAAHRLLQHGTGSGVDIATSWHGGVIAIRPDAFAPAVESLRWPDGFYLRPVWSGNAASTTAMLARLKAFMHGSPQAYEALMTKLSDCALAAQTPWRAADPGALFEVLQDYGELLHALDKAASIGIWSDGHKRLRSLAQRLDVGYKPSGAGGGDFGLAFSTDAERLDEFARQADGSVVKQPVELHWAQDGLVTGVAVG